MKIQPLKRQGYYTVFDNVFLDHVLPSLKLSSWAVFCVIMRKTIGWQKESDEVSYSQIKNGTGIQTNATVSAAIKELKQKELILTTSAEGKSNLFTLNREFTIEVPDQYPGTSSKIEQDFSTSSKNEQVPVQKLNTQNKGNKYIIGDDDEQEFEDIRSADDYRDLQNEIIAACKKLNALALKEKDVRNIDILYASEVKPVEVRNFYSKNGQSSWWYTQYWKGKKGQFPTTEDIIDTIEQARAYTGSADGAGDLAFLSAKEWLSGTIEFSELHPVTQSVVRDLGEYNMNNLPPHFWKEQFMDSFEKFNPDR